MQPHDHIDPNAPTNEAKPASQQELHQQHGVTGKGKTGRQFRKKPPPDGAAPQAIASGASTRAR
jgi:hypothetical protein